MERKRGARGSGMQSQDANNNGNRATKTLKSRQLSARVRRERYKKGGMNAETKVEEKPNTLRHQKKYLGRVGPEGDCGVSGRRVRANNAENHEGSVRNTGPERLACGQR